MPNPFDIICEILGQPAKLMTNPANAEYQCPFINSTCTKRSQKYEGPYPVCSIFKNVWKGKQLTRVPVIICPKRFYEAPLLKDILDHAWPGERPQHPQLVHEIRMGRVGNVDFVVADVDLEANEIRNFISAELQAVDITGSVEPAYAAITLSKLIDRKCCYNFNYANVRKRFVTQLINKGFFHHQWKTKMVAVVQGHIYENIRKAIHFAEIDPEKSNILFLQYDLILEQGTEYEEYHVRYKGINGTTHNELMMSALYSTAPPKEDFCKRILAQIRSGNDQK